MAYVFNPSTGQLEWQAGEDDAEMSAARRGMLYRQADEGLSDYQTFVNRGAGGLGLTPDRIAENPDGTGNYMLTFRPGDPWYGELIQRGYVRPGPDGSITIPSNQLPGALPGYGLGEADDASTIGPLLAMMVMGGAAAAGAGGGGAAAGGVGAAEAGAGAGAGAVGAEGAGAASAFPVGGEAGFQAGTYGGGFGGAGAGTTTGAGVMPAADYGATGLTEGGTLASEANFLPGPEGFQLGTGASGTAASGLTLADAMATGGAGGGGGGGAAASSIIPGISDNVLLGAGQAALGTLGAREQAGAYSDVAQQNLALGGWARDLNQQSYGPGFDLAAQPGYGDAFNRMADISTRQWSTRGNPANNPGIQGGILSDVWNQSYLPALSNYRGGLMQAGGLGLNTSGAAQLGGAQTAGGQYDALGYGLGTAMSRQPDWGSIFGQGSGGSNPYVLNVGGNPWGRRP